MSTAPSIGDTGARLDLVIRQGATFGPHCLQLFNPDNAPLNPGQPVDLTGCTLRAQLRRTALGQLLATFECTIVDAVQGRVDLQLDAATTAAITCGESPRDPLSRAVWDLELHDSLSRVIPLAWGTVSLFREATRDE